MNKRTSRGPFRSAKARDGVSEMVRRLPRAQEQTQAETLYLTQLIQNKTPVVVKLINDEEISGWIEYYDKDIIRITRNTEPNLFIFKNRVKYLFEDPDARRPRS